MIGSSPVGLFATQPQPLAFGGAKEKRIRHQRQHQQEVQAAIRDNHRKGLKDLEQQGYNIVPDRQAIHQAIQEESRKAQTNASLQASRVAVPAQPSLTTRLWGLVWQNPGARR